VGEAACHSEPRKGQGIFLSNGGMERSDADLVARVRHKDAAAFEELMRRYFRTAFLVAFAHVGNREDAEDVCQDAFAKCWERIVECRDPTRVGPWMISIVRNAAHNRRDYLRVRDTEQLDAGTLLGSPARPDRQLDLAELRLRLTSALQSLRPIQREVVMLHDYEGWNHVEVAARLDLSELMSRRHLSDARKHLREMLGDLATLEPDRD
jgi:RNA polymerase sigma-70 factor, ECF subfamily